MTKTELQAGNRNSLSGFLAHTGAMLLTLYALMINNITVATNDYTSIVIQAIACSCVAILLVVVAWRRVPTVGRATAVPFVLANLWTLLDAGGRRLPALLGW